MPTRHTSVSLNLRSARLRLLEAEQLIAAAGDLDTKDDIDQVLARIEGLIEIYDKRSI